MKFDDLFMRALGTLIVLLLGLATAALAGIVYSVWRMALH